MNLKELLEEKNLIEKAFNESKISEEYYIKQLNDIDSKIDKYAKEEAEVNINKMLKSNSTLSFDGKHLETNLICPKCKRVGKVSNIKNDFTLIGKDKNGFMYFECPGCKIHLQWDSVTGKIKSNNGILGYLFNWFS